MSKLMPKDYTYAQTIAEIMLESENQRMRFSVKQVKAMNHLLARAREYERHGFDRRLIDAIVKRVAEKVVKVTTIAELHRLERPSLPMFDGCRWITKNDTTLEEELVLWSLLSERVPLPSYCYDRMMAVFRASASLLGNTEI